MAADSAIQGAHATAEQLMLTFETMKLDGARQVLAEVVRLLEALGDSDQRERMTELMMDCVVVLPAYLDRLQSGHPDQTKSF